jgi:predicted dehydrogenase
MPLKLGMLGMWHAHGHGLVKQVALHPDEFTLAGFFDPDPKIVADRRAKWGPSLKDFRVFDSVEALLKEPLDGVVVEGRVHENLKLAAAAVEAGRSVMLEKPAGENLDEYRRLMEAAQKKHLHVQMIYLFRYMPATVEMITRARRGDLGAIYEFRARLTKHPSEYKRWVDEVGRYKGGIFFEMAGHVIDMMVAVLGRPKEIVPLMGHHHVEGPADFIDNGLAVFRFDRAFGIIEVPALEVAPHTRRIEVYGTGGAVTIPHLGSGHLKNKDVQLVETYKAGDEDWKRLELPNRPLQISDLREFAAVLARKKKPDFSPEHDLTVQETLLKACGG